MGIFLPADISQRVTFFIQGKLCFPFIKKDELIGAFFMFGKNNGIYGQDEILAATDLAKRTVAHLTRIVRIFHSSSNRMDSDFIRESYTKRVLEISVELQHNMTNIHFTVEKKKRIAGDPTILTNCFAQHIACHKQDQFFEIFLPLKDNQLPVSLRSKLTDRMLLLGYNVKDSSCLPYESTIVPFLMWLQKIKG